MAINGIWVPITMFVMIPVTTIGWTLARAYARRVESPPHETVPADVASRLERMEQAIDSIAIEVERISEGQRFTTRLLAERMPAERLPSDRVAGELRSDTR